MAVVVHWLDRSRAQRITWLLEELGVEYELKTYARDKQSLRAGSDLKEIHVLGKSPVIELDGKVIAESVLIAETLLKKYGAGTELAAKDDDEEFDIKYHVYHSECTVGPQALLLNMTQKVRERAPYLLRVAANKVADGIEDSYPLPDFLDQLKFLDDKLKQNGTGFFVGDHLSVADIMYIFPLAFAHDLTGRGKKWLNAKDYPSLNKWYDDMEARPAYVRAKKRSGQAEPTI